MKTYRFKTNIMCGNCIAKVTAVLNETFGETHWQVDIKDPRKILTVSSDNAGANDIKTAIEKTGYKAEELK